LFESRSQVDLISNSNLFSEFYRSARYVLELKHIFIHMLRVCRTKRENHYFHLHKAWNIVLNKYGVIINKLELKTWGRAKFYICPEYKIREKLSLRLHLSNSMAVCIYTYSKPATRRPRINTIYYVPIPMYNIISICL